MNLITEQSDIQLDATEMWHRDLAVVLRRYGFWGLDVDHGGGAITPRLRIVNSALEPVGEREGATQVIFVESAGAASLPAVDCRDEPAGQMLYAGKKRILRKRPAAYRPLLDFVSFSPELVQPIWQTADGRTVLGWWENEGQSTLLIGLRITEELVRYTQGDPARVSYTGNRNLWGGEHEQASFLYAGNIVAGHELEPWADRLGQTLAELLATAGNLPLLEPLPGGAKGAVMLTGDDDQAWLEKYDEQLALLDGFPITYLMLPHTNHTRETIAKLPDNVEFGVHVDALEYPDKYAEICPRQTREVRELVGDHPARAIRNHGHLNSDYWGHLPAWEEAGLTLGLNIRGLDGTCPTGSYLPFLARRPDGKWSTQLNVFSTFSDSMLGLQNWPEEKQIRCIMELAGQIEKTYPGILVFNFHPQNVSGMREVHKAVMEIGRRSGWLALGAESFLKWREKIEAVRLVERAGDLVLTSAGPVSDLAVRWAKDATSQVLPTWEGEHALMPI